MLILHHAYLEVDRVGFCKTYLLPGKYAYSCKDRTFACLVRCKKKTQQPITSNGIYSRVSVQGMAASVWVVQGSGA